MRLPQAGPMRAALLFGGGIGAGLLISFIALLLLFNLPYGRQPPVSATCMENPAESVIMLPEPSHAGMPLEEAIRERRSMRVFSNESLSLGELSQLLWAAQGITDERLGFRAAPSAGATYPLHVYVVPNRVEGTGCGIYLYDPFEHGLFLVREGEFSEEVSAAAFNQPHVRDSAAVFVIASEPSRTFERYGNDTERFVHIEAGHVAQNILLEATSLGLAASPIGSIYQDKMDSALGINGTGTNSVYVVIAGKKPD
ncbi:MAG: SagB/ThcOx family dehydrogenase [Candidatus Micrarchaeota archaeon]